MLLPNCVRNGESTLIYNRFKLPLLCASSLVSSLSHSSHCRQDLLLCLYCLSVSERLVPEHRLSPPLSLNRESNVVYKYMHVNTYTMQISIHSVALNA